MMLLSILIPTYNRQHFLLKNLCQLSSFIRANGLNSEVNIIISNNCSPDDSTLTATRFQEKNKDIAIEHYDQSKNIGLEANALFVLEKSRSEYIMYLGDDDFINEKFLLAVVEKLRSDKGISCIIPSYINIDTSGNKLDSSRDVGVNSNVYLPGFDNCLENSYRGHQLSGLVVKREGLLDSYRKNKVSNIYLFIYFASWACLTGKTWHFTDYPVLVTAAMQKDKDWGYGNDGLLGNVFDNYRKLDGISYWQRSLLELRFLQMQKWRYEMYLRKGKPAFVRAVYNIIFHKNTTWLTKVIFPYRLAMKMIGKII